MCPVEVQLEILEAIKQAGWTKQELNLLTGAAS
jgi:hypothetical protein